MSCTRFLHLSSADDCSSSASSETSSPTHYRTLPHPLSPSRESGHRRTVSEVDSSPNSPQTTQKPKYNAFLGTLDAAIVYFQTTHGTDEKWTTAGEESKLRKKDSERSTRGKDALARQQEKYERLLVTLNSRIVDLQSALEESKRKLRERRWWEDMSSLELSQWGDAPLQEDNPSVHYSAQCPFSPSC